MNGTTTVLPANEAVGGPGQGWRVVRGVLAAAVSVFLMLPPALFLLLARDMGQDGSVSDLAGGALVMVVIYAIVIGPVVLIASGLVFGIAYVVLRAVKQLSTRSFALVGAAAVTVPAFMDSSPPSTWSPMDYALLLAFTAAGAAAGFVFWRFAAPAPRSS